MSRYFLAPYLFTAKLRHKQKVPYQPIDDLDGKGSTLQDSVANIIESMVNRKQGYQSLKDAYTKYTVTSAHHSGNLFIVTVEPGRRGQIARLEKADGNRVERTYDDTEHTALRAIFYFPKDSTSGLIFMERLGLMGAIAFLGQALRTTLTEHFPNLTFKIEPLTTLGALSEATLTTFKFKAPRKKDTQGKFLDYAPQVTITSDLHNRRAVHSIQAPDGKIDPKKVFGVLSESVTDAELGQLNSHDGWGVSVTLQTPEGRPVTFNMDSDGPALVYALNHQGTNTVSGGAYPDEDDLIRVAQTIISDVIPQYGLGKQDVLPKPDRWMQWSGEGLDPWEVKCFDHTESDGDITGTIHD